MQLTLIYMAMLKSVYIICEDKRTSWELTMDPRKKDNEQKVFLFQGGITTLSGYWFVVHIQIGKEYKLEYLILGEFHFSSHWLHLWGDQNIYIYIHI